MTKKVLIVDDETDIRDLIAATLKGEDMDFAKAASGEEAVERLKKNNIDVVLLDIMMPGMNGYETAEKMRKFSKVPIIVVSIKAKDVTEDEKKRYHFSDVIQKPFESMALLHAINNV